MQSVRLMANGIAIPHGLYDLFRNIGYVTIGTSHGTSEFACACIRRWWLNYGQYDYPDATSLLLLCDSGGSNNAHYYIFKQDLSNLLMNWVLRSALLTIHPTHQNTTRSNTACFLISHVPARALSSRALNL
jgi:hypothetical protein